MQKFIVRLALCTLTGAKVDDIALSGGWFFPLALNLRTALYLHSSYFSNKLTSSPIEPLQSLFRHIPNLSIAPSSPLT